MTFRDLPIERRVDTMARWLISLGHMMMDESITREEKARVRMFMQATALMIDEDKEVFRVKHPGVYRLYEFVKNDLEGAQ